MILGIVRRELELFEERSAARLAPPTSVLDDVTSKQEASTSNLETRLLALEGFREESERQQKGLESAIGVLSEEAQLQLRHSDALHTQLQEMRSKLEGRLSSIEATVERSMSAVAAPPVPTEVPGLGGGLFGAGGGLVESFSTAMRELQRLAPQVEENTSAIKELAAKAQPTPDASPMLAQLNAQLEEAKHVLQEALLVRSDVAELAEQAQSCAQEVEVSRRDTAEQAEKAQRLVGEVQRSASEAAAANSKAGDLASLAAEVEGVKREAAEQTKQLQFLGSQVVALSTRTSTVERAVGPVLAAKESKVPLYFSLEQADTVRETAERAQRALDEVSAVGKRVASMEKRIVAVETCCMEVAGVMKSKVMAAARQALDHTSPVPVNGGTTSSLIAPGKVLAMDEECLDLAQRVARSEEALRKLLKQLEGKVTAASDLLPKTGPRR